MPPPLRTAIDIGTNTLLALTGRVREDGTLERAGDWAIITRLGAGVDRTKRLAPDAMARTLDALADVVRRARALGTTEITAVATSAVRDADNREEFLSAARLLTGGDVNVAGGTREAELTFAGAVADTSVRAGTEVLVFDVGGGSTEVIRGSVGGSIRSSTSINVGSVRLTERFLRSDPPTDAELRALAENVRANLPVGAGSHAIVVGVAATVTTLAAIEAGVDSDNGSAVHGGLLTRVSVEHLTERLGHLSVRELALTPGIDPRRADVIAAGAIIVCELLRWSGASSLTVSNGGVRVGLLFEATRR